MGISIGSARPGQEVTAVGPRQVQKRLGATEIDRLVEAYLSGRTVYELAAEFGVERRTVSAHLHRRGASMRRRGLSLAQKDEVDALRDRGWSLARIGARFDVDAGTVRNHLIQSSRQR